MVSQLNPGSGTPDPHQPSPAVERVLSRLDNARPSGRGWSARCPSHDDRENSLSVGEGDEGRALVKCFAGCTPEQVVQALGMEMSDLFLRQGEGGRGSAPHGNTALAQHSPRVTLAEYADAKRLTTDFLKSLGLSDFYYAGKPAIRIPYCTADGGEGPIRFRIALHKGRDGADKRFTWKRGSKPTLYGLERLAGYREKKRVLLVEGESDCHTGWFHGIDVVGLPGASNWKEARDAPLFDGFDDIAIIVEPDKGGEAIKDWLGKSRIRDRVRLVSLGEHKDLSDLHLAHPDPAEFREHLDAALRDAVPWEEYERERDDESRAGDWEECKAIAAAPDILDLFAAAQRARGIVGEEAAMKLIYLALTSRLLDTPVSVAVKGPSSGGKSYITERTLDYFPEGAYYALSAMSERALAYSTEPLEHRFLVLYEAAGIAGDMGTYLIRSLLSENCVRYETVVDTPEGHTGRLIEREGPTGLLITTTETRLHPENETRLISLLVTDTPDQTKAIMLAMARNQSPAPVCPEWIAFQRWLAPGDSRVVIPFAEALAEAVPAVAIRLRRDFGKVLALIRTHAILHQATRERDADGRIVATLDDYQAVRGLVAGPIAAGLESTVPPTTRETVRAVKELSGPSSDDVSVAKLAAALNLDKSAASRRVKDAIERGFLRNEESRRGKPARLRIGDPLPDDVPLLPSREELAERCTNAPLPDKEEALPPLSADRHEPMTPIAAISHDSEYMRWVA